MKPPKLDQQPELRRSSRIQTNKTKRNEDDECEPVEPVQKKPKKDNKQDVYFSIFSEGSKKSTSERPEKCKVKPLKKDKGSSTVNQVSKTVQSVKKPPNQNTVTKEKPSDDGHMTIDLIEDHEISDEIIVLPKPSSDFNFVSSFFEQELPLIDFPNHVHQLENDTINTASESMNFAESENNLVIIVAKTHDIRSVNNYFAIPCSQNADLNSALVKSDNRQTLPEDYEIWVDRYKPKCVKDVAGHSSGVELLVNWLADWKCKLKPLQLKSENSSSSYDMSDDEDGILKCVVLRGRCGIGKTSAVYAIAQELGFKVFEVNPSSSRVGRQISMQLQEATLSHHVEGTPKISPFFKQFPKVISNSNATNLDETDACSEPAITKETKVLKLSKVKPKPGEITNFFKKVESAADEVKNSEQKNEPKQRKRNSLLNFFKPQSKDEMVNTPADKVSNDLEVGGKLIELVEADPKSDASGSNKKPKYGNIEADIDVIKVDPKGALDSNHEPEDGTMKVDIEVLCVATKQVLENNLENKNSTGLEIVKKNEKSRKLSRKSAINPVLESSSEQCNRKKNISNVIRDEKVETKTNSSGKEDNPGISEVIVDENTECVPEISKLKFSSLSVILFDDADVNLSCDEGFWTAINSFLKVTRKPVVLTASQSEDELCNYINSEFCVVDFDRLHKSPALEHLKTVKENENLDFKDSELMCLFKHCKQDMRQCILQLQFWNGFKKSTNTYKHAFGIPVPVFCLDVRITENIMQWIFEWELGQAAELLFMFSFNQSQFVHNNINSWLPLKHVSNKSKEVKTKAVKKYKRLDISWLSDEASDAEQDVSNPESNLADEHIVDDSGPKTRPDFRQSLKCLSNLYSSFSDSDVILKSDYESCSSFWKGESSMITKHTHSHRTATEIACWTNLISAKNCKRTLEEIQTEGIKIINEDSDLPSVDSLFSSSYSLERARQMITKGVLSHQCLNNRARCVDYLSMLRTVSRSEEQRKQHNPKRSRRFLHYFESSGFIVEQNDLLSISNAFG